MGSESTETIKLKFGVHLAGFFHVILETLKDWLQADNISFNLKQTNRIKGDPHARNPPLQAGSDNELTK